VTLNYAENEVHHGSIRKSEKRDYSFERPPSIDSTKEVIINNTVEGETERNINDFPIFFVPFFIPHRKKLLLAAILISDDTVKMKFSSFSFAYSPIFQVC
jgi:hypothetical protein